MSSRFKTKKVTEMGRLVTRAQLQSAANQIAAHVVGGLQKLEDAHDERLLRIEQHLGLLPIGAKPTLVKADDAAPMPPAVLLPAAEPPGTDGLHGLIDAIDPPPTVLAHNTLAPTAWPIGQEPA